MATHRALMFSILLSATAALDAGPALAQACTRQGLDVACDDGRRGVLAGDTIIWADGTRSSLTSPQTVPVIRRAAHVPARSIASSPRWRRAPHAPRARR